MRAPDPRNEDEARDQRAGDRADGIRGVDAAGEPRGILLARRDRRERQRKARAPEDRARQHHPQAAHEIELERVPRRSRDRWVDRPVRQRFGEHVGGPGGGAAQQQLTPAERAPRRCLIACDERRDRAPDAEADEKHREDQREGVDRRAEVQRQQPRPDHFSAERRQPGQRDRDVDRCVAGWGGAFSPAFAALKGPRHLVIGRFGGDEVRDRRDCGVDRDRGKRRDVHVVDAQQIEACDEAADDAAGDVAAVEKSEPRHPFGRRLHPARDRRQRGAHQHRRRQQADAGDDGAHEDAHHSVAGPCGVKAADERHAEEDQQPEHTDARFERRVHAQRMLARRDRARHQHAAKAHAAHERAEEDAEGDRRRPDDELEELEPDDLVNQRRAAAADEENDERGKIPP